MWQRSTMETWAREVKGEAEVPMAFQSFFHTIVTNQTGFSYAVFAPPERWCHRKINPKLVCVFSDKIYIAEKSKKTIKATCFYFKDINYIEQGTLLLNSWLAINGCINSNLTFDRVGFNSVLEDLFKPIIFGIRTTINNPQDLNSPLECDLSKEQSKFNSLGKISFKFMNYGKKSIIPGESIIRIIFQTDIQTMLLKFFPKLISVPHLTILTNRELIIVTEDQSVSFKTVNRIRYGGIWYYIPLLKIIKLTLEEVTSNLLELTIVLPGDVTFRRVFLADKRSDLELIIQEVDHLKMATSHLEI